MRFSITLFLIFTFFQQNFFAQENTSIKFPDHFLKTKIVALSTNDSLTYYQCHVEELTEQLITSTGEKITGKTKKSTITDKFVVTNKNGIYHLKYYTSTFNSFPNRKFTYLKIKEKEYWNFTLTKESDLNEHDVLMFAAIENKSHDTNEFDFVVDKYNTNALIITNKKMMRHLLVEGNYLLKKNLEALK